MATLEIDLNCMCLFAPDPERDDKGIVHVLMPRTTDQDHQGEHVARLFHRSFYRNPTGRPMEGWALDLGTGNTADTRLKAPDGLAEGEIVDMTELTGTGKVSRTLVADQQNDKVLARVTFRSGGVSRIGAETTKWTLKGGPDVIMAHQVVWRMEVPEDSDLVWRDIGATSNPPLKSLKALPPDDFVDGKKLYRLSIHHVTTEALPPKVSNLSASALQRHFKEYFKLLGVEPEPRFLPKLSRNNDDLEGAGVFACKETRAELAPS